jgi:hypothetical protein
MIQNKKNTFLFLFLITFLLGGHLFAQQRQNKIKPDQYRAVHWGIEDGLSAAAIHTLIKDV